MGKSVTLVAIAAFSLTFGGVKGLEVDVNSVDSLKSASSSLASNLISYIPTQPGSTIGLLEPPYFFWESGLLWDTLLQYTSLTSTSTYASQITSGLLAQTGPHNDFMPPNVTNQEANDDQSTWALASLTAAESSFPSSGNVSWITYAENVWNEQFLRWDETTCGGGLRWQIYSFLTGYDYKNSPTNGNFFQLSARLARYTGNKTYVDWATKSFEWSQKIGFVDKNFNVFDGATVGSDCSAVNKLQFSYGAATYLAGAAYMYNTTTGTDQSVWKTRVEGLANRTTAVFFKGGIATEVACEGNGKCNIDMKAYKGILGQALSRTVVLAPFLSAKISSLVQSTAKAASASCGSDGKGCGSVWNGNATKGGVTGAGEQIGALSFVLGGLAASGKALVQTSSGNGTGTVGADGKNSTTGTTTNSGTPAATTTKSEAVGLGGSRVGFVVITGLLVAMAGLL